METIELKFLLRVLGYPGYRAPITKIKPNPKTIAADRDRICRRLRDRGLVDCRIEVKKFKLLPAGKALLKLETADLPLTEIELKVLQRAKTETVAISPAKLSGIPAADRQPVVQTLAQRGLIKIISEMLKEVWLTETGKCYLQDECNLSGISTVTLDMMGNYVRFLRRVLPANADDGVAEVASTVAEDTLNARSSEALQKLDDAAILQSIEDLDNNLGTENYLPIFHLRQQLQPPLSRDELDRALYRLQQQDRIELSSLQEAAAYTSEQIAAGIPQDIGGPLFFIVAIAS